ncbi:WhiB family transcriptional regulator [Streptomyces sp. NPDC001941]|uniref:WhiB family transcriptional regulator n=1 Tax=Streptomyces sp. NPDC001941 TaxID=3154659 RepID=UPI00332A9FA3
MVSPSYGLAVAGRRNPHLALVPSLSERIGVQTNPLQSALCTTVNPEVFFATVPFVVEIARRVCERCPVQRACLQGALERGEQYGMWGGLTPEERRELRRPRRKARKTAEAPEVRKEVRAA